MLQKRKLLIRKQTLIDDICLVALMEPPLFSQINTIDNLWLFLKLIAFGYIVAVSIKKKASLSMIQFLCIIFFGWMIISTFLNDGNTLLAFRTIFFNLVICYYFDLKLRENGIGELKRLSEVSLVYLLCNAILLIAFPNGVGSMIQGYRVTEDTRLSFLGRDNAYIFFFIPAIISTIIANGKKSKITITILSLTILTMVYVWSGTGVIGCALIILYYLFAVGKPIDQIFSYSKLILLIFIIYIGVVFLRVQDIFSGLIIGVLGKDLTFSGRTYLWDSALLLIGKKPWIGYGITETSMIERHGSFYSPHNLVLQIILAGGIVAFTIFVLLFVIVRKKLNDNKNGYSNLIAVSIFIYLLTSMTEATMNSPYLYMLLIMAYNYPLMKNSGTSE